MYTNSSHEMINYTQFTPFTIIHYLYTYRPSPMSDYVLHYPAYIHIYPNHSVHTWQVHSMACCTQSKSLSHHWVSDFDWLWIDCGVSTATALEIPQSCIKLPTTTAMQLAPSAMHLLPPCIEMYPVKWTHPIQWLFETDTLYNHTLPLYIHIQLYSSHTYRYMPWLGTPNQNHSAINGFM